MNIIEEHRSKVRAGENTFSVEVTSVPGGDRSDRLVISVGASGPNGEQVAEGQVAVSTGAAAALGAVLSETLRHHSVMTESWGGGPRGRPAGRGRPWTVELDAELERRWIAGRRRGRDRGAVRADPWRHPGQTAAGRLRSATAWRVPPGAPEPT